MGRLGKLISPRMTTATFPPFRSVFVVGLVVICLGGQRLCAEERPFVRTALVVGNERYEATVGRLRNTGNDAKAVAQTLRGLGFSVIERHDLTRDQLLRAVAEFRRTLPGAEVGLFYYAGHGLSIGGANYLIPLKSDFHPEGADDVTLRMLAETHLFNAEQAVADMASAGAGCNLVILDACRSTRLPTGGRTRGAMASGGLSEMTPPAGSLIAFATDAGRTAFDGDGAHGLYTEELLKNLRVPGLTIEQVFKRTRAGVVRRSEGGQVPAEYSRLVGEDIFLAGAGAPVAVAEGTPTPAPTVAVAVPVELPGDAELMKFATNGQAEVCVDVLRRRARADGPKPGAAAPLNALLEHAKDDLAAASAPSPKVIAAAATCALVLEALPDCLPKGDPKIAELSAKALNRRGDALLLLERPEEAVKAFDAAVSLAPNDAYILYNRGRANLALDRREQARADFTAAASPRFNQPKARRLAERALAGMK
jgi:hypothetical protein